MTPSRIQIRTILVHAAGVLALSTTFGCVAAAENDDTPVEPRDLAVDARDLIDAASDAESAWDAACPGGASDGLCMRVVERAADPASCAAAGLPRLVVTPRESAAATRAIAALDDVIDASTTIDPPADPVLRKAYEQVLDRAKLARLDADFEAFVAHTPRDLTALVSEKNRGGAALTEALSGFKRSEDPRTTIRAALRTSWVATHVLDVFLAAPVPDTARDAEAHATYCAAMHESVAPMVTMANDVAKWCHDTAAERGYSGTEVSRCDALVTMLDPVVRR
jgi:hypothetical protein